jgi:hypothetical protein
VQFSNGEVWSGNLSLTPGADFRLHIDGAQIRALDFDRVREIRLAPAAEKMVQRWRFPEAGKTKKEAWGQPYLTRDLQATVFLGGAEKITGHVYTTVLYLEDGATTRKVVLPAKQRGQEGAGADKLVYPAVIRFTDEAAGTPESIRLRVVHPEVADKTELAGLTWGALFTLEGKRAGPPGQYALPSPLGRDLFLAVKTGQRIVAGWPVGEDPAWTPLVQTNLANAEDFFDERRLLGVYYDEPNLDLYSLLMLWRKGRTTMEGDKTQPWRLVVLRWKYDPETRRVLLAGRGYLFRGILGKDETPPEVQLSPDLWRPKEQGDHWQAGGK